MANKRSVGGNREQLAGQYLTDKGMTVIARNYHTRMAEIDLICKEGDTYVFVEVKYRSGLAQGHPLEAVTPAKQGRIRKAALMFLEDRNLIPDVTPIRFDVVGILDEEIFHVEDAF